MDGNTNSHCSLQTLLLGTKYPILLKYMNQWTDSARKWGLESESKSKIKENRPYFTSESVQRLIYLKKVRIFVQRRRVCKEQWELLLPSTKLDISLWCRCFRTISILIRILDLISGPNQSRDSHIIQKIGYFVHRRRVCKEQWELLWPYTKLDISLWCRCFRTIFDFDSDSRPHFRSESVQRFIYYKENWILCP